MRADVEHAANPAVSVIVPTYNYERFLRAAIDSVRHQTLVDWECLIVDDGSTDSTAGLIHALEREDSRVLGLTQVREGPAAARNRGIKAARGRFIQFLDADDLLSPSKLAEQVDVLEHDPLVDVVYGSTAYFDDANPNAIRRWHRQPGQEPFSGDTTSPILRRLLTANIMTIEAPLVRRGVLDALGGFDERLLRMEDWDLWIRCALQGYRFEYFTSVGPVALVRVHPASASYSQLPMLMGELAVRGKVQALLTDRGDRLWNRDRADVVRCEAAKVQAVAGEPMAGLRLLLPRTVLHPRLKALAWCGAMLAMFLPGGGRFVRAARAYIARRRAR